MQRLFWITVLVGLLAVQFAPAVIVIDFKLDQERIARELCVQRDRVEAMRTCHGHCQVGKRLKELEHEAAAGFPVERIQHRFEPVTPIAVFVVNVAPLGLPRSFPRDASALLIGTAEQVDHVPRS